MENTQAVVDFIALAMIIEAQSASNLPLNENIVRLYKKIADQVSHELTPDDIVKFIATKYGVTL